MDDYHRKYAPLHGLLGIDTRHHVYYDPTDSITNSNKSTVKPNETLDEIIGCTLGVLFVLSIILTIISLPFILFAYIVN
jgi:hypothetical protein